MKFIKENTLDIILWSMIIGILFAAFASYKLITDTEIGHTVITKTVIDLPPYQHQELSTVDGTVGGKL